MYPQRKIPRVVNAQKPWRDSGSQVSSPRLKFTNQEEIDICLKCKRPQCPHGECIEITGLERRVEVPMPDGFETAARSGYRPRELSRMFNITDSQCYKFRRRMGLVDHHVVEVDLELFLADVRSGKTMRQLMAKHHIGRRRALGIYDQLGLPRPSKRRQI